MIQVLIGTSFLIFNFDAPYDLFQFLYHLEPTGLDVLLCWSLIGNLSNTSPTNTLNKLANTSPIPNDKFSRHKYFNYFLSVHSIINGVFYLFDASHLCDKIYPKITCRS